MTQAQRETTNHIEFQVSLLKLLAKPEEYAGVKLPNKSEQAQMEELVAQIRRR